MDVSKSKTERVPHRQSARHPRTFSPEFTRKEVGAVERLKSFCEASGKSFFRGSVFNRALRACTPLCSLHIYIEE